MGEVLVIALGVELAGEECRPTAVPIFEELEDVIPLIGGER
ncbi:MAG: hypothetical protein JWO36_6694 [Myxococcales bacterium]|nr:hypothetical protein [Myxococcales bacterium]